MNRKDYLAQRQQASIDMRGLSSRANFTFRQRVQHLTWFLHQRGLCTPAVQRMMQVVKAERDTKVARRHLGLA